MVDAVIDEQLGDQRGQEGDPHTEAEPTARSVERPPQPDGECGQGEGQLGVVVEIHFGAGMVDPDEHGHTAHHAGPLSLKFMRLSQVLVNAGV